MPAMRNQLVFMMVTIMQQTQDVQDAQEEFAKFYTREILPFFDSLTAQQKICKDAKARGQSNQAEQDLCTLAGQAQQSLVGYGKQAQDALAAITITYRTENKDAAGPHHPGKGGAVMQWNDKAIILSVRRLGEHSGVIHLLTPTHGLHAGVDRGAFGSRRRGIYQQGNVVEAQWQARLSEHIGTLTCELADPVASRLLDSRMKLAALSAATQMVERTLAERDPQPAVYARMLALLTAMCYEPEARWLTAYVQLEYTLLECAGFGLDLSRCAATGQSHDLHYVSPRSGRGGEP